MQPEERFRKNENIAYYVLKKSFPQYQFDEDFQQIAKLALWKACMTFDADKSSFSTYAYRCCCNEILMELRKKKGILQTVSIDDEVMEGVTFENLIPCEFDFAQSVALRESIKMLDERKKRVLIMSASGYTQREIGEVIGVTQTVVCRILKSIQLELMEAI